MVYRVHRLQLPHKVCGASVEHQDGSIDLYINADYPPNHQKEIEMELKRWILEQK